MEAGDLYYWLLLCKQRAQGAQKAERAGAHLVHLSRRLKLGHHPQGHAKARLPHTSIRHLGVFANEEKQK